MVAGGYLTYHGTVLQFYGISVTGNSAVKYLYAYQFLLYAEFLLGYKGFTTYELGLVQFTEHSQTGFDGADIGTQFITVKRHSCFKTQGIAATQTTGLDTGLDQAVPYLNSILKGGVKFKAILSGITRAAYSEAVAVVLSIAVLIETE